ncbi:BLUF domain-containing protein [Desertivirga arenae]|uniref:BLUF domain-containing protein n=1 Tax=Desertivirga arenae TaxID=2810309 RepID=UPI001A962B2D|nr:BLUF domain-containing protein [Pedobacter sp. SYSU D00823]
MQITPLTRIVYVSTASEKLSEGELQAILTKSRSNNAKKNITGLLIYSAGNIMQVLEGDKQDLENLYKIINQDPRHFGVIKLQEVVVNSRIFSEWSMGFKTVSPEEFKKVEGYLDIRDSNTMQVAKSDDTLREILELFINNNQ